MNLVMKIELILQITLDEIRNTNEIEYLRQMTLIYNDLD